jgi:hypothetical protein
MLSYTERGVPMMTQCEKVLEYMKEFGSITPIEAMQDIGCMRLAARIADLIDQGYAIGRRMKTNRNRYGKKVSFAEYYLEEDNNA